MPRATLTSKGQMTIPKDVRDRLNLHPGDQVDFIMESSGEVILRPATIDVQELKGILARKGQKAVSVAEMNRAIKRRFGRK